MPMINISFGRYSLHAVSIGSRIKGFITLNDEGGGILLTQEFNEHHVNDIIKNVMLPLTDGNSLISQDLLKKMMDAGFK